MEQKELLEVLAKVAGGIAQTMGKDTEVAVHDLKRREMYSIANGHVTDRKPGAIIPEAVYEMIMGLADENDYMTGYSGVSSKGKNLRCSHIILRDDAGEPAAMMCINQDTSKLEDFRNFINSMIEVKDPNAGGTNRDESITAAAQKTIVNTLWKMNDTDRDSKEGKILIIKELRRQGVFDVKAMTPYICQSLQISQTTLYNYLREIRNEEASLAGQRRNKSED
ncbi:MAG: PAS domain-containing protein [Mogibacterium sp.]|nr:PAS domain-containing protein [Mogibacterium sp.]